MRDVLEAMLQWQEEGRRGAVATVLRTRGSTPQVTGARLALSEDGRMVGTVGGGAIEQDVLAELRRVLEDGQARVLERDLGRDLGMSCGGSMELFLEPLAVLPRLIVVGAGHVARATVPLVLKLGFRVVVVDARAEHNHEASFPRASRLLLTPEQAAEALAPAPAQDDWLLCVSHSHAIDARALTAFAGRSLRYMGLMGSKRKIYTMLRALHAKGVPLPLERIYAPVGLALGAKTPDEIAVSIAAELVAVRHGEAARHMRVIDDPAFRALLSQA